MRLHCYKCGVSGIDADEPYVKSCHHCHNTHWFIPWDEYERVKRDYDKEAMARLGPIPEPDFPPEDAVKPTEYSGGRDSTVVVPQITRDKQHKYFDWTCGQEITSRSQKKKIYAAQGLIEVSAKDEYRNKEKPRVKGRAVTYGGQKNHKSSAETGGVRTADGRKVV